MDEDFWGKLLGFSCPIGDDGFPVPGELMRVVRESQGLTQAAVAVLLGVSRTMVTKMETNNDGLGVITTRRQLSTALGILPIALGIVDVEDVEVKPLYDTTLLRNMLDMHYGVYFAGGDTGGVEKILQTISNIVAISKNLDHKNQEVLEILALYNQLGLDVAREEADDSAADDFAKDALSLAKILKSKPLRASALLRYSSALYERGDLRQAKGYADNALKYVNAVPEQLAGTIYISVSKPYADLGDSKAIELAEKGYHLSKKQGLEDSCFMKLTTPQAHQRLARAMLHAGGDVQEAMDMLNDAEEKTDPRFTRRLISIKTQQAVALVKQKEYPLAAELAQDAATGATRIQSKIHRKDFTYLHNQLSCVGFRAIALRPFLLRR